MKVLIFRMLTEVLVFCWQTDLRVLLFNSLQCCKHHQLNISILDGRQRNQILNIQVFLCLPLRAPRAIASIKAWDWLILKLTANPLYNAVQSASLWPLCHASLMNRAVKPVSNGRLYQRLEQHISFLTHLLTYFAPLKLVRKTWLTFNIFLPFAWINV